MRLFDPPYWLAPNLTLAIIRRDRKYAEWALRRAMREELGVHWAVASYGKFLPPLAKQTCPKRCDGPPTPPQHPADPASPPTRGPAAWVELSSPTPHRILPRDADERRKFHPISADLENRQVDLYV